MVEARRYRGSRHDHLSPTGATKNRPSPSSPAIRPINQPLQILHRRPYILLLPRPRDLALNRNRPRVIQPSQLPHHLREIHFPLADRHFLAQVLRISRIQPIFCMQPAHILPNHIERRHRIAFPIQNQIRRIQIHAHIVQPHILNRPQQRHRRLLPRLHQERLPIRPAITRHFVNRLYSLPIKRLIRILWNKSAVRMHRLYPAKLCQIRRSLQRIHPRRPRLRWHQPNRQRPLIKIPNHLAFAQRHCRRRFHSILRQRRLQRLSQTRRRHPHAHLAARQPKGLHFRNRLVRCFFSRHAHHHAQSRSRLHRLGV